MSAQPFDPATCTHPEIGVRANADITTLKDGTVGAYRLTVTANCVACGTEFWFPSLPTGQSYSEPVTSIDGFAVTLPMVPEGKRLSADPRLLSTMVRNNDIHKGRKQS